MNRSRILFVLIAILGSAYLASQTSAPAQGGKKDDLAKTNQQLQKTIKEREATIQKLQQRVKQLEADAKSKLSAKKLQQDLDKAHQSIKDKEQLVKDKEQLIATLRQDAPKATAALSKEVEKLRKTVRDLESIKKAPLVHTTILKLKKEDDARVKEINDEVAKTLTKISGVRGLWIGRPADVGTPELAQKGYQLGIVVLFDDADGLQKYLDDPLHKQFNDKLGAHWERPVVYDIQRDAAK